tara:strand:- start:1320 stop:2174 length:855 start_codon:yes stop_codon:yes gene_type:complete
MIIWLASYPKSGNTLVRSMLSAYFFSKDGKYDFEQIKNIKQFPKTYLFKKIGVDITNEKEIIKNYINVQKNLINKKSVKFFKTHSYLFNIHNNKFTDLDHSLGAIYIVRDPRNVVTSWANHSNYTIEESANGLINANKIPGDLYEKDKKIKSYVYVGNWSGNYNSWKSFKYQDRYLLIKYEDLIDNKELCFKKILSFICKLQNKKFIIDDTKFKNVLESTDFEKMKALEKNKGFFEAKKNLKTGKSITFFNLGPKNDWKQLLNKEIREKIETAFKKEMLELGYL